MCLTTIKKNLYVILIAPVITPHCDLQLVAEQFAHLMGGWLAAPMLLIHVFHSSARFALTLIDVNQARGIGPVADIQPCGRKGTQIVSPLGMD